MHRIHETIRSTGSHRDSTKVAFWNGPSRSEAEVVPVTVPQELEPLEDLGEINELRLSERGQQMRTLTERWLSSNDLKTLAYLCQGLSQTEIADRSSVVLGTIQSRLQKIRQVTDRTTQDGIIRAMSEAGFLDSNCQFHSAKVGRINNQITFEPEAIGSFRAQLNLLSDSERELLDALLSDAQPKEIGVKLFISPYTFKLMQAQLFKRLGVKDRVLLTCYAHAAGLLGPIAKSRIDVD